MQSMQPNEIQIVTTDMGNIEFLRKDFVENRPSTY